MNKEKRGTQRGRRNGPKPDFRTIPDNLWRARVVHTNDFEYCAPGKDLVVERGDFVVIPTRYGRDMARILGPVSDFSGVDAEQVRLISRMATDGDFTRRENHEHQEEDAYRVCRGHIDRLHLPMKLASAHYILDEQKVMFFFTADNRIDFRELVKDLVAHFQMRIELRQIGVRDESRAIGGVAVCGRQYCCHNLTDKLSPVSIKMAKEQSLSLTSLKISGPCGRLLCCLAYEHDYYSAERKKLPREGNRISWDGVDYKVVEVNVFTGSIHLAASEGSRLEIPASQLERKNGGGWKVLSEEAIS